MPYWRPPASPDNPETPNPTTTDRESPWRQQYEYPTRHRFVDQHRAPTFRPGEHLVARLLGAELRRAREGVQDPAQRTPGELAPSDRGLDDGAGDRRRLGGHPTRGRRLRQQEPRALLLGSGHHLRGGTRGDARRHAILPRHGRRGAFQPAPAGQFRLHPAPGRQDQGPDRPPGEVDRRRSPRDQGRRFRPAGLQAAADVDHLRHARAARGATRPRGAACRGHGLVGRPRRRGRA